MKDHLIIIGGTAAGVKAASKARRLDPELKISIYTSNKHISYSACGIPYFIEGIIKDPNRLLIRSSEVFKEKFNINVYKEHFVRKISPSDKSVEVENLQNGEILRDRYTKLLIASGARAFLPDIEGVKLKNIFTLRTFEDGIKIEKAVSGAKKAVIIGAGYIGLEMAEAFINRGLKTTIIEQESQILPVFDSEIASIVQKYLEEEKNIKIYLNKKIRKFISKDSVSVSGVELLDGEVIDGDIILVSIGVRPNTEFLAGSGVETGILGAIRVNEKMQSSVEDIYAAGDCAESTHIISKKPVLIPLGSTANKHGRVAAMNICGKKESFNGVLGSHVSRVFDFNLSGTGLSEKSALKEGFDIKSVLITNKDKSGYYPGAEDITIKMIAENITGKLLGAQVIGKGNVDKEINIIATALTAGLTVDKLVDVDITYAPPYSPAIDSVIIAAELLEEKVSPSK